MRFKSCKITSRIPLEKLTSFFRMQRSSSWREYIVLNGTHLENVLKKHCGSRCAYLFEFGCVTFVDFDEFEIQIFLEFLAGMVDRIDYSMFARFAESHTIDVSESSEFRPWNGCIKAYKYEDSVIPLISVILAKSVALDKIEIDVSENMDESEKYIEYLRKGRLRISKKALSEIISGFLKFEYESINNIRIFDRSIADNKNINCREIYDSLAEYYELNDRFDVLQSKIKSLRSTIKTYNSLSYQQNENRMYLLEIFLLGLFPLVSVIRLFLGFKEIIRMFNLWVK